MAQDTTRQEAALPKPYYEQYLDAMRQSPGRTRPQQAAQPASEPAALPLLLDPRSFLNPRDAPKLPTNAANQTRALSAQGREALRGAQPSSSSGSAAMPTAVPNFSKKLPGPKPPTR